MQKEARKTGENLKGLPRFIRSWRQVYLLVIVQFIALLLFFYLFTLYFH